MSKVGRKAPKLVPATKEKVAEGLFYSNLKARREGRLVFRPFLALQQLKLKP